MSAHVAWSLVCRLFACGTPVFRGALSSAEVRACDGLGPAIKATVVNRTFTLCPYCQLRNGQIIGDGQGGQICQCPECGPIPLAAHDRAAVMLDENWLQSKLRMALEIESRDGFTDLGDSVWRLGEARGGPVLLARDLIPLCIDPSVFERVRVAGAGIRVITPASVEARRARLPAGIEWLPLDERFVIYGGAIAHIPAPSCRGVAEPAAVDPAAPVNGPFSEDFRWVTLDGEAEGAIHCTPGQAAVFKALWGFKGQWRRGEQVMRRAGLTSGKPSDVFKAARYEGPRRAYQTLVLTQDREGLYAMPCAAQQSSSTT
jgi:hypothetical protein